MKRRRRALNVLEFEGMALKKKEKRGIKKKRVRVRVWGRKKKEKEKMPCVEDKKRGGKKEKRIMKYYHNFFIILSQLLLANIGKKKIIFLEREKHNFNSTLKLKSISIFITIFS